MTLNGCTDKIDAMVNVIVISASASMLGDPVQMSFCFGDKVDAESISSKAEDQIQQHGHKTVHLMMVGLGGSRSLRNSE